MNRRRKEQYKMKTSAAFLTLCGMALALYGCPAASSQDMPDAKIVQQFESKDINSHAVRSIRTVVINRIAVMPIVAAVPFGGDPLAAGAADSITAALYRQAMDTWKVVPQNQVMRAVQQSPSNASLDDTAIQVGQTTGADAVIYGSVERYVERVGADYAAQSPASVAFSLKLVDMKTKQIVWTARYSKTQQPLANNFFNLPTFLENKGQWLRANDLANDGVKQAMNNLRTSLGVQPAPAAQPASAEP